MKKNKNVFYGLIVVLLIIGIFLTYTVINKKNKYQTNMNIGDLEESLYTPKEIDTSEISLDEEVIKFIESKDDKNADRDIENYKRLIVELDVPKEYQEKINEAVQQGYNASDILISYNFIYEKYGQVEEVDKILQRRKTGSSFEEIFEKYNKENKEFAPTEFKDGYIDEILENTNLNMNDIMIADRISQKGLAKFEDLIELRKKDENWRKIKIDLGILNLEETLYSTTITSADIAKYSYNKDITEEQVIRILSITRKANTDNENLIKELIDLDSEEEIYSKIYIDKYGD